MIIIVLAEGRTIATKDLLDMKSKVNKFIKNVRMLIVSVKI